MAGHRAHTAALPYAPSRRSSYINWGLTILFAAAIVASAAGSRFAPWELVAPDSQRAVGRFVADMFPPNFSPDFLRLTGRLMLQTLEIAIIGTAIAVVLGMPLGIAATRLRGEEVSRNAVGTPAWLARWTLYYTARTILNILRAVPELVWALIFVVAVGLGPFPGVLALAAHSTGILGKLYSELFESSDQRLVELTRSTGASEAKVFAFARLPMVLPVFLSYTFFRWECNMRAASVLGLVGAGGIGTQMIISTRLFRYDELLTLMLAVLVLVALVDIIGQVVRSRVLESSNTVCTTCIPSVTSTMIEQRTQ